MSAGRQADVTTAANIPLHQVELGPAVDVYFTGRPTNALAPNVGRAGNLSHRRPHVPARLAADREALVTRLGISTEHLVWMEQVHSGNVHVVGADEPPGVQVRSVDGLVTAETKRALVVQTADCVPVLLSAGAVTAAVHAGRRGLVAGIVGAAMAAVRRLTTAPAVAAIGPAIGGCCYEVPAAMRDDVARTSPATAGQTTWGTPSLDLPAGVRSQLAELGVAVEWESHACTKHDVGWFSHRADPDAGRQLSIIVQRPAP